MFHLLFHSMTSVTLSKVWAESQGQLRCCGARGLSRMNLVSVEIMFSCQFRTQTGL